MNIRFRQIFRLTLLAVVVGGALLVGGCKTDDQENLSMRPWNAPKGWENGMPGGLTDRYR